MREFGREHHEKLDEKETEFPLEGLFEGVQMTEMEVNDMPFRFPLLQSAAVMSDELTRKYAMGHEQTRNMLGWIERGIGYLNRANVILQREQPYIMKSKPGRYNLPISEQQHQVLKKIDKKATRKLTDDEQSFLREKNKEIANARIKNAQSCFANAQTISGVISNRIKTSAFLPNKLVLRGRWFNDLPVLEVRLPLSAIGILKLPQLPSTKVLGGDRDAAVWRETDAGSTPARIAECRDLYQNFIDKVQETDEAYSSIISRSEDISGSDLSRDILHADQLTREVQNIADEIQKKFPLDYEQKA